MRRHRGQQGQQHTFQRPLTDLGLQHPPCGSPAAQQDFSLGTQIAQLRLHYQVLPSEAQRHGLWPLIRHSVGSARRLTCRARQLRLDWLLPAASQMEPD